ncbi:MAG: hypothetical protein K6G31_07030 [Paludibacteraceae bacterium]|nr:hypothetical protein [Paludibacteraceae bacterium]
MTKIYTYLFLLCFAVVGKGGHAQCPAETLRVNFNAYEISTGNQVSIFKNDSVENRLKKMLGMWLNTDADNVSVSVKNNPPSNFYRYDNASTGVENTYSYNVGNKSGNCPVVIRVLDTYKPYCGDKNWVEIGRELKISTCTPTKEQLDVFFENFAREEIGKQSNRWSSWNDVMWSKQYGQTFNCEGSGLKEAHIDWSKTVLDGFRIDGSDSKTLDFYYLLLDNEGNVGQNVKYENKFCTGRIKVKRTNFDVDFVCPDQSVLSDTEVILDLPKEPEGEYITWNTGWKSLKDSNNKDLNNSSYAWTPAGDGISVTSFPKEGVYKLTLEAKVCNWNNKKIKTECPVYVVETKEKCDAK